MAIRLRYYCPFACLTGYGEAAHNYLLALKRYADVELDIVPLLDTDSDNLHPRFAELLPYVGKHIDEPDWPDIVLVHAVPAYCHEFVTKDLTPHDNAIRIALTTWETEPVPKWMGKRLETYFDAVIVPSAYNETIFNEVLDNTIAYRIPHCFDPEWYGYNTEAFEKYWESKRVDKSPYTFLWVGAWVERKNPIGVAKAFLHTFTNKDNVKLKLLSPGSYGAKQDIELLKICAELQDQPHIELITHRLTDEQLLELYYTSHCYVSAHHGEGFGLGACESALVGNPIIATAYGGMEDFMKEPNDYFVPYMPTPAIVAPALASEEMEVSGVKIKKLVKRDVIGISITQTWAEPNLPEMAFYMRQAYNRRHMRSREDLARLWTNYSYKFVAEQFETLFKSLRRLKTIAPKSVYPPDIIYNYWNREEVNAEGLHKALSLFFERNGKTILEVGGEPNPQTAIIAEVLQAARQTARGVYKFTSVGPYDTAPILAELEKYKLGNHLWAIHSPVFDFLDSLVRISPTTEIDLLCLNSANIGDLKAAMPLLHKASVIFSPKNAFIAKWLEEQGWSCVLNTKSMIFVKG